MLARDFCTCDDFTCTSHPRNHEEGCARCVKKCLIRGEIPGCFFRKATDDFKSVTDYTMKGFAKLVLENDR